jgi:hypothetical protein
MLISVDFPAPLGPSNANISPLFNPRDIFLTATLRFFDFENSLRVSCKINGQVAFKYLKFNSTCYFK